MIEDLRQMHDLLSNALHFVLLILYNILTKNQTVQYKIDQQLNIKKVKKYNIKPIKKLKTIN